MKTGVEAKKSLAAASGSSSTRLISRRIHRYASFVKGLHRLSKKRLDNAHFPHPFALNRCESWLWEGQECAYAFEGIRMRSGFSTVNQPASSAA